MNAYSTEGALLVPGNRMHVALPDVLPMSLALHCRLCPHDGVLACQCCCCGALTACKFPDPEMLESQPASPGSFLHAPPEAKPSHLSRAMGAYLMCPSRWVSFAGSVRLAGAPRMGTGLVPPLRGSIAMPGESMHGTRWVPIRPSVITDNLQTLRRAGGPMMEPASHRSWLQHVLRGWWPGKGLTLFKP